MNKSIIYFLSLTFFAFIMVSGGAARDGVLPEHDTFTLNNGLEVILIEDHHFPLIDFQMPFYVGSSADSMNRSGLAALTSEMLREGNIAFHANGEGLSAAVDASGGQLFSRITRDRLVVVGNFLSRDVDFAMGVLAQMVISPRFSENSLEQIRHRLISNYVRSHSISSNQLENALYHALYGNHGFGLPTYGTQEGLENIELGQIENFRNFNICPNNAALVVGGDFKSGKLKKKIKALFNKWEKGGTFSPPIAEIVPSDSFRIILIDQPNAPGTEFIIGRALGGCRFEEVGPMMLLDYILGGGGEVSRLSQRLRSQQLVTNVYSMTNFSRISGTLIIRASTTNNAAIEAVRQTLTVLKDMRELRVPASELEEAKNYFRGRFPGFFESSDMTVEHISNLRALGLDLYLYDQIVREFEKIEPKQIRSLAGDILDENKLTLVIAGPGYLLKHQLMNLGTVDIIESGRE